MSARTTKWNEVPDVEMPAKYKPGSVASEYFQGGGQEFDSLPSFPPPVEFAEWIVKEIPDRPEVIEGLLRQGDKMTIGGSSKSRKTWFVAAMALCVAAGRPWHGMTTVKTRVLFVNLELPEAAFHKRMVALATALCIAACDVSLSIWNLRGQRASIERLDAELKAHQGKFGLIVIDPLYKMLGKRKENVAEDMADLLGILEAIATDHDAAIVIPAHYSKGNQSEKESIDRISGSGVFARDADCILSLTAHEQQDCFTAETVLRSFAPIEPVVLRWEFPLFRLDHDLDPGNLKKAPGRTPSFKPEQLLEVLPKEGLKHGEWERLALSKQKVSKTTFNRLKAELHSSGQIEPSFGVWKRTIHP